MGSFSSGARDGIELNVPAGIEVISLLLAAAGEAATLLPEESDEGWERKRKRERESGLASRL